MIFVYKPDERRCLVFDLDSDLPFPTFFHKVSIIFLIYIHILTKLFIIIITHPFIYLFNNTVPFL